ncbi:MAG: phage tail tube protein [Acidobacteriota bacterium]
MTKYDARGTQLEYSTDGGSTWTKVAQVINITGPGLNADTEDATDHDSPGGFEEVLVTILRTGEVTLELHYDPADPTHDASDGLISLWENRTEVEWRLTFPDAANTEWTFDGYVISPGEPSAPHDGKLTSSVTIKVTGEPTLA